MDISIALVSWDERIFIEKQGLVLYTQGILMV